MKPGLKVEREIRGVARRSPLMRSSEKTSACPSVVLGQPCIPYVRSRASGLRQVST